MECGVLALEPPPSYTASMNARGRVGRQALGTAVNSGSQYTIEEEPTAGRVLEREREGNSSHGRTGPKGSPPPYPEEVSRDAIHMGDMSNARSESATSEEDVSSV